MRPAFSGNAGEGRSRKDILRPEHVKAGCRRLAHSVSDHDRQLLAFGTTVAAGREKRLRPSTTARAANHVCDATKGASDEPGTTAVALGTAVEERDGPHSQCACLATLRQDPKNRPSGEFIALQKPGPARHDAATINRTPSYGDKAAAPAGDMSGEELQWLVNPPDSFSQAIDAARAVGFVKVTEDPEDLTDGDFRVLQPARQTLQARATYSRNTMHSLAKHELYLARPR
ncbi:hypothetical protein GSI_12429 [Ganoderma sinense ZZ0214-1]|uniref:Uncharacterized protein n=1 Tax=Ganoderma sinense ZZ0214-1 TaxID=1077348 RepID=A0A2G8RVG9_9APHY|nr:hypothetical protein GSI_12429 [Ganoderma sinense ZZ0214-1]